MSTAHVSVAPDTLEVAVVQAALEAHVVELLRTREDPRAELAALAETVPPREYAQALLMAVSAGAGGPPRRAGWLVGVAADRLVRELGDEDAAKEALGWGAKGLFAMAGGEEAALELLQRTFELDPNEPSLLRSVGDYHLASNEWGEAARFYERYLEVAPGASDHASVALRLGEIALHYGDLAASTRSLSVAVHGMLPEGELPAAMALCAELSERQPEERELPGLQAMLSAQGATPAQVEASLHRWCRRASPEERADIALRLGRLRESRLADAEGAAIAYEYALRLRPSSLPALGALERVRPDEPAVVLRLAIAAAAACETSESRRFVHALAARVALRAGELAAEAHHRMECMRLCPDDAMLRRRASVALRRAGDLWPLVEVLRAEAAYGDRVTALLSGAEMLLDSLARADLAMSWAAEAHAAAREGGRAVDAARALDLIDRARRALDTPKEVAPAVPAPAEQEPPHGHPLEAPLPNGTPPSPEAETGAAPEPDALAASDASHGHPLEAPLVALAPEDASTGAPSRDERSATPANAPAEDQVGPDEEPFALDDSMAVDETAGSPDAAVAEVGRSEVPATQSAVAAADEALARAVALEGAGEPARAIEALEEALRHQADHREALERVANLYADAGRTEAALRAVEALLAMALEPVEEAGLRALRALWHPSLEEAERELQRVLDGGIADLVVLDLCIETAKARGLWKVGAALQERRYPL